MSTEHTPRTQRSDALTGELWFFPGMDGTGRLFRPLLALLENDGRARRVFEYGEGGSFDALLDALPAPSTSTVLVAESFGGPLAVRLAARHPELVMHIVLIASFLRAPRPLLRVASLAVGLLPAPPALAIELVMVGRDAEPALVSSVREAIRSTPRSVLSARLRSLAELDVTRELASLPMPVTALVATHDRLVPRALAEEPGRLARRGRVVEIEGPHLLAQTKPRAVADAIEQITRL